MKIDIDLTDLESANLSQGLESRIRFKVETMRDEKTYPLKKEFGGVEVVRRSIGVIVETQGSYYTVVYGVHDYDKDGRVVRYRRRVEEFEM